MNTKHRIIVATLALMSLASHAGAKYQEVAETAIIPLDMATTVYSFDVYRATPAGMEVCLEEQRARMGSSSCSKWTSMTAALPPGKSLVGWRISHREYGYRVLDIYFK